MYKMPKKTKVTAYNKTMGSGKRVHVRAQNRSTPKTSPTIKPKNKN
jgi:hypothetical protein